MVYICDIKGPLLLYRSNFSKIINFKYFYIIEKVTVYSAIILCQCFNLFGMNCFLYAKYFYNIIRQIAHIKYGLVHPHHLGAWNISRVRPCVAFTLGNNFSIFRNTIKFMQFWWAPNGDSYF